ncbi:MAG: penicillin-binding protein 2, partial [Patescibacteria group bacterium]
DKATPDQIAAVRELGLRGVYVISRQYRYYPSRSLGSHLVGFVGVNETTPEPAGLYGIEKREDAVLAEGADVHATVDWNLQSRAEQVLQGLMEEYEATGGTVIIQEPATGKILAMASKPDFDPNEYKESSLASFINPAVQYVYEPGSVMKSITMAAGISLGAFTSSTRYVDTGSITLNRRTITNYDRKAYGKATMTNVLEHSINTGAVFAEQQIGHDRFFDSLKNFGFGARTGIGLVPDEVAGDMDNLESRGARAIDFATASFGQGIAVTPLQLVTAYSVIANGGLLMKPYLARDEEPYVVRRVIDADAARDVTGMLELTVRSAKVAVIEGYRVAGKTGTALIPGKGGYTEEMIHTFVGFAPASNPKAAILVKLDQPSVGELAGLTVVPAFRDLMQFTLNHYRIPPDNVGTLQP